MKPILHIPGYRCRHGVALVIVLAFVVLVTGLVLAFFSRAMLSRQVSNSSASQTKADLLARGALDVIVGDLNQEISAGSTNTTVGNFTVFTPTAADHMLPLRSGNPPLTNGIDPIPNLIRRSVRSDSIASPAVGSRASAVNSTNASSNGRAISAARWNSHFLIPKAVTTDEASDPVASFTPPDWVIVTRGGPVAFPVWDNSLKDSAAGNQNFAIGRYAFAIYDMSGLLDMNVAGYPTGLTPAEIGKKGAIAFADLKQLGTVGLTQTQIDNIVGWRNSATAQPAGGFGSFTFDPAAAKRYQDYASTNATGFLKVGTNPSGQTDQAILSRQQLIDLRRSLGFSANALQYMGTFSRALNAPSWRPTATVGTPAGNTIDYAGQADSPSSVNRNLPNVRFSSAANIVHYRDDGTIEPYSTTETAYSYKVQPGEPLIQRRFSLAKLAWLAPDGPKSGISDAAIKACFGIEWNNSKWRWEYVAAKPAPGVAIKTLDQVAAEVPAREPNFFELLNAGILSGSLGRDPGKGIDNTVTVQTGVLASNFDSYKAEPNLQILQIGANIIDQADKDSYPTAIYLRAFDFSGHPIDELAINTVYGDENLPGLLGLLPIGIADPVPQSMNDAAGVLKLWLQPQIWNPHQVPAAPLTDGYPTGFRAYAYGTVTSMWFDGDIPGKPLHLGPEKTYYDDGTGGGAHKDLGSIYFSDTGSSASPFYNNPRELTVSLVDGSTTASNRYQTKWSSLAADVAVANVSPNPNEFVGFAVNPLTSYGPDPKTAKAAKYILPDPVVYFSLQYKGTDGNYHPYNFMARITQSSTKLGKYIHPSPEGSQSGSIPNDTVVGQTITNGWGAVRPDPRTDRFSAAAQWWANGQSNGRGKTMNPKPNSYVHVHGSGAVGTGDFGIPYLPSFHYDPEYTQANLAVENFRRPQIGLWARNDPSFTITVGQPFFGRAAYYADPDGVVRYGNAYRANTATGDGSELYHADQVPLSAQTRRPVILNRPFRSVGELGFAYRDLPFKSLDFWSPTSADGALLDLFSVSDQPAVVAGQINPNSASAPVLQAIFAGGSKNSDPLNLQISAADAKTLATFSGITTDLNANGPYTSRADLATRLGPLVSKAGTGAAFDTTDTTYANWSNKAHGEAPVRALADVTNTRTWNLMIDVIAQTGMFSPTATNLNAFLVQGEHRYWLHVAIDRFTGKIVDQQLEPVYE